MADSGGFELIPPDDELSADERLDAALSGFTPEADPDELRPFGRGWAFDFEKGEFVAHGSSPARVTGIAQLEMWIEKTLRTARGAHVIYPDDHGMESPWEAYGQVPTAGLLGRLADHIRVALTAHDRISSVEDFRFDRDPGSPLLMVSFRVIVDGEDEGESVTLDMNGIPLGRDI